MKRESRFAPVAPIDPVSIIQDKQKATFNLSNEILSELEDVWTLLRKKLKDAKRITKTLIIEESLRIIFDDLEQRSELSELFKQLKQKND